MSWRFGSADVAAANEYRAGREVPLEPLPVPPEPYPSRVEAFITACAMHAGQREHDLINIVEGLGKGFEDARKKGGR